MSISTIHIRGTCKNLPVEEVHPQDPPLILIHMHTSNEQALAPAMAFWLTRRARQKPNESHNVRANRRNHLEHLVLYVFLLRQRARAGGLLFPAHEDRGRDAREDEAVKQAEGEELVFLRDDGG
jgi:hypothetical protein